MTLLFVRHGESTWNAEGRYQGQLDAPLSELGVRQARAVAERLCVESRPAAIVSSPLARARGTAEIIGARCNLSVSFDERLTEICHGEWEGLLVRDVAERWPATFKQWHDDPASVTFPEGESLSDVETRLRSFIGDVGAYASPLVVCTHDVIIRLAMLWAKREPLAHFFAVKSENGAITEIAYADGVPRLIRSNDHAHLDGLRSNVVNQAL